MAAAIGAPRIDWLVSITSIAADVLRAGGVAGNDCEALDVPPFSWTLTSPGRRVAALGKRQDEAPWPGNAAPLASVSCAAGAASAHGRCDQDRGERREDGDRGGGRSSRTRPGGQVGDLAREPVQRARQLHAPALELGREHRVQAAPAQLAEHRARRT